ncbi:MAG: autotransporter-associated beta strand repeat-containing protein, partial [Patescibacteria group bacterium]|nr:autotransporter-associated beta strand repeat-containing protein [Patescibacteria group bacterium]
TINGSGTVVLPDNVTSTGVSTLSVATLDLNGATRTFHVTDTLTVSSQVINGGLTKAGSGTLTLSGANTYTGETKVDAGTLRLGNSLALQNSTFDTQTGTVGMLSFGTLTSAAFGGLQGTNDLALVNAASVAVALTVGGNNASTTFAGSLSGTGGGLTKTGTGTLTLSGTAANTHTGLTTVSAGTLQLSKTSGLNAVGGDLTIATGGRVTFASHTTNEQIANTATVTMSGATSAFNGTGFDANYSNINETIGSLIVTGGAFNTGTGGTGWNVTGAASFTGGAGNTKFLGHSGSTSRFGSLSLTNMTATAGGTPNTPNSFTLYGNNSIKQSSIFVGSGGLTLDNSVINLRRAGAGALGSRLVLDGNVTTTGTAASSISEDTAGGVNGAIAVELSSTADAVIRTFNVGGGGANLTVGVPVTNGASTSAGITKTGAGMLTLGGVNTFSGNTKVDTGILRLGNALALQNSTFDTQTGAVGTLSFGTLTSATFGGLQGANGLALVNAASAAVALTVGGNNASTTFSGSLSGTGSALTKTGSGTLTLSGSMANTYTGLTTVSAGTLQLSKVPGANAIIGDIQVNSGKLRWNAAHQVADTASITLNNGTLETNTDTVANLTINNTSSLRTTYIHGLTITDTLTLAGGMPFLGSTSTTFANKVVMTPGGAIEMAANAEYTTMNIGTGGLSMSDAVWHLGMSTLASPFTARINLGGNFEGSGTNSIKYYTTNGLRLLDLQGATRTFNITDGTTTIDATIQSGGMTKTGSGTLTLNGANTYTGPTSVEAGTLLVNGSIASDVTVNGGWLKGNGTVGGVVVGSSGSISAGNSPGLLSVDGDYEQSGLMLVELAGTTQGLTYDSIAVSGAATFGPGAVIDVNLVGFDPLYGDVFDILTAGEGINADLSSLVFDYSDAATQYFLRASIVSLGGSAEA